MGQEIFINLPNSSESGIEKDEYNVVCYQILDKRKKEGKYWKNHS